MHFQYIFEIRSCLLATYELPNFDFSFFVLWRWDNVIFEGLLAPMQHKVSHKSQNFFRHLNASLKIFFGCYRISFFDWASVLCKYGVKIKGARTYEEVLLSSLSSRADKKTIVWQSQIGREERYWLLWNWKGEFQRRRVHTDIPEMFACPRYNIISWWRSRIWQDSVVREG